MIPGIGGGMLAGVGRYRANAVAFDGTNDYLTRGAGLTGAAGSKLATLSAWLKVNADGVAYRIWGDGTAVGGATQNFGLRRGTGNLLTLVGANAATTEILNISSSAAATVANGWFHFLASVDMADTAKRHIYIDDVSDLAVTTYTNDTFDFTMADWAVGARPGGTTKFNGDMADLWFEDGLYTDFSVVANRRKFISADLKPVDLGSNGSIPFGAAPIAFFSGVTASWETNKGTGGGFTEVGALADASTSPSD